MALANTQFQMSKCKNKVRKSFCICVKMQRYSDHIGFPIYMKSQPLPEKDDAEKTETKPEWEAVNQSSALWTLQKSEISGDEYQAFYKHVSHDFDDALSWSHNYVEGAQNY